MFRTAPSINHSTDDDDKLISRKRDALRSELTVLWEARRRLIEAEAVLHEHAAVADQLQPPSAAADDGQQLPGAAGDSAGSLPQPPLLDDDDFYPLDDPSDDEPTDVQWQDHLRETEHGDDDLLVADSDLDDDEDVSEAHIRRAVLSGRLHVPRLVATRRAGFGGRRSDGRGGFGAVPASAAAIAGLEKRRYDGGGGDSRCVVCIREYRMGDRLRVMPCEYRHRFHRKCLKEWLSWSHLCPLCRHALPTQEQEDAHR